MKWQQGKFCKNLSEIFCYARDECYFHKSFLFIEHILFFLIVQFSFSSAIGLATVHISMVSKDQTFNWCIRTVNIDLLKSQQQFVVMCSPNKYTRITHNLNYIDRNMNRIASKCNGKTFSKSTIFVHCIFCVLHIETTILFGINKLQIV